MQHKGRKKIPNSREKTGRKQGAQAGHKGHCRKKHAVTESHEIPAPEKYTQTPDYYETGRIIRKQKVAIKMSVSVTEYTTKEYRNRVTGARVHAPFPKGYVNEVNYDGTIKAFAFLLGNECNVSHAKIKKLISEMTNGEVDISVGMINGLCKEFSEKDCNEALKRIYDRIDMEKINGLVEETPFITSVQKEFYQIMLGERKEKILDYSMELLLKQEQQQTPIQWKENI